MPVAAACAVAAHKLGKQVRLSYNRNTDFRQNGGETIVLPALPAFLFSHSVLFFSSTKLLMHHACWLMEVHVTSQHVACAMCQVSQRQNTSHQGFKKFVGPFDIIPS